MPCSFASFQRCQAVRCVRSQACPGVAGPSSVSPGRFFDPAFDVNQTKKNDRIDSSQRNTRGERLTCVYVIEAPHLPDHVQVETSAVPRAGASSSWFKAFNPGRVSPHELWRATRWPTSMQLTEARKTHLSFEGFLRPNSGNLTLAEVFHGDSTLGTKVQHPLRVHLNAS
jgi:hypothetical protein